MRPLSGTDLESAGSPDGLPHLVSFRDVWASTPCSSFLVSFVMPRPFASNANVALALFLGPGVLRSMLETDGKLLSLGLGFVTHLAQKLALLQLGVGCRELELDV